MLGKIRMIMRACSNQLTLKESLWPILTYTLMQRGLTARCLFCEVKKALAGMQSGEVIYITATDPGSVKDFTGFVRMTGHELLESREEEGGFHFLIRNA